MFFARKFEIFHLKIRSFHAFLRFILIDPKGWTGFEMKVIKPLLVLTPGEVLVNFMTGHIKRFLESPDELTQGQMEQLFGDNSFRTVIAGLDGLEREYAAVEAYANNLAETGGFSHVCKAIVLNPQADKTHHNLIYATRSPRGVEVFKQAEKAAMEEMEKVRAKARQRQRVEKTGQRELLGASDLHDKTHFEFLRDFFIKKAKSTAWNTLSLNGVPYDEIWKRAMSFPLVWESDLKDWLKEWRDDNKISYQNFPIGQRVPKRGQNILIVRK